VTCDSDRYENNTGEIMKKRVLVVDDEKEILAILKRFLIRIGYEPFTTCRKGTGSRSPRK